MSRNAYHGRRPRKRALEARRSRHHVLRERDRRRAARRRLTATLVLGGAAAVIGYVAAVRGVSGEPVALRSIAVQGLHHLTAAEVASASGLERGAPLAGLDPAGLVAKLEQHPWIESARAVALPDGTLVVRVAEREPAAWVSVGSLEPRWVDASGRAFAPAPREEIDTDLWPEISGASEAELDPAGGAERLARAVALARLAVERGVPGPVRVSLPGARSEGAGWVLSPRGLPAEAWLGDDVARFSERLGRLARLLEEDPAHARLASQIDLRFAGRAFLRFADSGASGTMSPSRKGTDPGGGGARMRAAVQTRPTG